MSLICSECSHPIQEGQVEWVNDEGELKPFHTGPRYEVDNCAYIARHRQQYKNKEFFLTEVVC